MMNKVIKLSLKLTLQNEQEVSDLISILQPFSGKQAAPQIEVPAKKETPKKPSATKEQAQSSPEKKQPAKATPKKETPAKETEQKAESPKKETAKAEPKKETENSSDLKIEDIRSLLAKKVGNNREEIKAKLTELDAKNVTNLDKSKYLEFIEFLNNL